MQVLGRKDGRKESLKAQRRVEGKARYFALLDPFHPSNSGMSVSAVDLAVDFVELIAV